MATSSISFGAPMVRALLAGAKSQTRRVVKPQPAMGAGPEAAATARCPYGARGRRLWVREAFRLPSTVDALTPSATGSADASTDPAMLPIEYAADGARRGWSVPSSPGRLRSPMFMPRWASRLALVVVAVRVERLRTISAADALAEGVDVGGLPGSVPTGDAAIALYAQLWERIHGPGAWAADPWVWVVGFRVAADQAVG